MRTTSGQLLGLLREPTTTDALGREGIARDRINQLDTDPRLVLPTVPMLTPTLPPGRANRKALVFVSDIHRLRNSGYTFSAIRTALLEAGVNVSLTTVKREAARASQGVMPPSNAAAGKPPIAGVPPLPLEAPPAAAMTPPALHPQPAPPQPRLRPAVEDLRTPRQVAEDFMQGQITNPLLRSERNSP